MPLLTLHLCRLNTFTSNAVFLQELQADPSIEVVVASRPRKVIIKPAGLDSDALSKRYDIILLLRTPNAAIPSNLRSHVWYEYKINVGIPGNMMSTYPDRNAKLINEAAEVTLTGALEKRGKQELDTELYTFIEKLTKSYGDKPVTMLNLLHFNDGKEEMYNKYGEGLKPIMGKRGGDAKLVGKIVHDKTNGPAGPGEEPRGSAQGSWWDQFSLVHYPSIRAFGDMLAGEDYQEINGKYRAPVGLLFESQG